MKIIFLARLASSWKKELFIRMQIGPKNTSGEIHSVKTQASVLCLIIYTIVAIILFPAFHYTFQTDTLQYLVIAQKYANGFFADAVNSYWSPLFSWLIAIVLKTGIESFTAIYLIQLTTGIAAIYGVFKLIGLRKKKQYSSWLIYLSLTTLIFSFAILVPTPDLLLATIGIWYMIYLSRINYLVERKYPTLIFGILGTLLYFAKAAGFFFFLLSYTAYSFYVGNKDPLIRKAVIKQYIISLFTFLFLSSFWVAAISKKEKKILISSTLEYNFNIIGPAMNPYVFDLLHHPYENGKLVKPPDENSVSGWETPQKMETENWSPLANMENFIHYMKVIGRNLISIQSYYFGLDAGTILLLGLFILFFINRNWIKKIFSDNILPLTIAFSCTIPYLFVLVMERHIWINNIVILMLAVSLFDFILRNYKLASAIFLFSFCGTILLVSIKELVYAKDNYSYIINDKAELSEYLAGNTASMITVNENGEENYTKSTVVNYVSKCKYYGMIRPTDGEANMENALRKNNINYLLVWDKSCAVPNALFAEKKSMRCGVTIYKLNQPSSFKL